MVVPEFSDLFLSLLDDLKLSLQPEFEKQWANFRDTMIKFIHESNYLGGIALCKKFNGQQMLVKIAYDTGDYHHIYEASDSWGQPFVTLALRVVYVLDKRNIRFEEEYSGLKLNEIFASNFKQELIDFIQ